MAEEEVGIGRIEAARRRIAGAVRRTPLIDASVAQRPASPAPLLLKLECLQVTGSFKPRGAMARATALDGGTGLITASGGNHGLGVAYAAARLGRRAVVYLPSSAPSAKAEKLARWGAEVRVAGAVWDEANAAALEAAGAEGLAYIHPFADPEVIAGQGTVGLEIAEDAPEADTVVVAIGGGGLISGVATALKARRPGLRIVGVEPAGAPTHHASRQAGRLVTLERIATAAGTLAPRRSAAINFAIVSRLVDDIVLVTDEEMRAAACWLWSELGIGTELAGAATVAAVMTGRATGSRPLAVVCGSGSDGVS